MDQHLLLGLQSHFGDKPVKFQYFFPQTNAHKKQESGYKAQKKTGSFLCPRYIYCGELSNKNFPRENRLDKDFSAGLDPSCWKSTLITPHTGRPMRCCLDHADRLREGFALMRAAWAYPWASECCRSTHHPDWDAGRSTLITPYTWHPMGCGLDHDDRLREGFDLMRAAGRAYRMPLIRTCADFTFHFCLRCRI